MNPAGLGRLRPLLILVAALFLLANAVLLRQYLDGQMIRQETRRALVATHQELAALQVPSDLGQLAAQLAQAEAEIKVAEEAYPRETGSFDLLFQLSQAAAETGIAIAQLRAEPVRKEKLGSLEHWAVRYTIEVNGPSGNLANFMDRVEKLNQSTLVLDNIVVRPAFPQPQGPAVQLMAAFQVVIYSREEPRAIISAPLPPIALATPRPQ